MSKTKLLQHVAPAIKEAETMYEAGEKVIESRQNGHDAYIANHVLEDAIAQSSLRFMLEEKSIKTKLSANEKNVEISSNEKSPHARADKLNFIYEKMKKLGYVEKEDEIEITKNGGLRINNINENLKTFLKEITKNLQHQSINK